MGEVLLKALTVAAILILDAPAGARAVREHRPDAERPAAVLPASAPVCSGSLSLDLAVAAIVTAP